MSPMKVIWAAALFFVGWMWFYLFIRQLLFNFTAAYPLIRSMNKTQDDLIAIGAKRYTTISVIVMVVISAIICFVIVRFCKLYLTISFLVGAVLALIMYANKLGPKNRDIFDTFCGAYYRFVPDDVLRTAMYNKKPGQMKARLHEMGLSTDFIPEFK